MIRKEAKNKKLIMVGCNILFLLLLFMIGVSDSTSDDYGSQMILFSQFGKLNPWSSAFWSMPVYALQNTFPALAWQYVVQILIVVATLNVFINKLFEIVSYRMATMLAVLLTIVMYHSLICKFNFTQTSAVGMAAGFLLMFSIAEENYKRILSLALGAVLMIFSAQIRPSVIFIFVGCFVLTVLYCLVFRDKKLYRGLICGAISLVICMVLYFANKAIVSSNPDFAYEMEYIDKLVTMIDYDVVPYDEAPEMYAKLDMSANDVSMINRKCTSDPDFFNLERLQELVDKASRKASFSYFVGRLPSLIKSSIKLLLINQLQFFCFGILAIAMFSMKKRERLLPIGSLLMIIAYLILFAFMGRLVERVIMGVVILAVLPSFIILTMKGQSLNVERKTIKQMAFYGCYCLILIGCITVYGRRHSFEIDKDMQNFSKNISEDTEHFYVYELGIDQNYRNADNLLLTSSYLSEDNSMYINMPATAPYEKVKLDKYGISNVYKDSVGSDVIRFVLDKDVDQIQEYIRNHYDANAELVLDDSVVDNYVYKVVGAK